MTKIVIYTKQYCPYCDSAKELLKQKGAAFEEIRIDLHPERRDEMISKSDGRKTVPQIFINDQGIGGCDDLWALERAGKLDSLLTNNKR